MEFRYERVRKRRDELEMSQSQVANKGNLPLHDVQNVENDKVKNPSHQTIMGLSFALEVEPAFFYDNYVVDLQHQRIPRAAS